MIDNTGKNYENQKKLYAYQQQQQQVPAAPQQTNPNKNQPSPQQPLPQQAKLQPTQPQPLPKVLPTEPPPQKPIPQVSQKKEQIISEGPPLDDIASLKMLDSMMEEWKGSAAGYEKILEKKMKLMDLIKRKEMTADKYKATLEMYAKKLKGYV